MNAQTVQEVLVGASFLVSGAIAWRSHPTSRVGPLMVAFGLCKTVGNALIETSVPLLSGLGIFVNDASNVVFVLLLLVFPDGRLRSRRHWLILGPVAVALLPMELAWLMFLPADALPWPNGLSVWPSAPTADAIDLAQRVMVAAAELALAVVVLRRWRRATPPLRRVLTPAVAGTAALLALSVAILVNEFLTPIPPEAGVLVMLTFLALPVAMLVTMLRLRLDRAAVGALLVDLGEPRARDQLRAALSRALGDPSLDVAYWVPEYETYVREDGTPVELAPDGDGRATTLVERGGTPLAALLHDASLNAQPSRLAEVAAAASIALDNARLQAELLARLVELKGSRARAIKAADTERQRLERNLHDGAQGRLVALSLELRRLEARLAGDPEAQALLDGARQELATSLQELREVARGIHPAVLRAHGLEIALESLAVGAPLPVTLRVELAERLPEPAEVAAYYLVSEALANTAKHAMASAASVEVHRENGRVVVEVSDDGVGGADTAGGSGLRGLADRVEALDGSLRVWSPAGAGTRIHAEIPCA